MSVKMKLIKRCEIDITSGETIKVYLLEYESNGINACCCLDKGEFAIYINIRLNQEEFYQSFQHEIGHIIYGDLTCNRDVDFIEGRAHDRDYRVNWEYEVYFEKSSKEFICGIFNEGIRLMQDENVKSIEF